MKAVVMLGEGKLEVRDLPSPVPAADEVIVRIKASGMCGTDLAHLHGPAREPRQQMIEGHEPCGVVMEVGSAVRSSEAKPGDRVMVHHYDGCRTCDYCRSGWPQLCPNAKVIYGGITGHGSHAPLMKVPVHTLVRLPDELSFTAGAAIACGAGTAFSSLKRVGLTGDQTVAVFGQGPLGLSCTLFAKAMGARVIAIDISDQRLERAQSFGADVLVNSAKVDPIAAIRGATRGNEGAHSSIECSGNKLARQQAVEAVKRLGVACMVGAYGTMEFPVEHVIQLQKTVLGVVTFSKQMMNDCAQYVVERGIDLDRLYTHRFSLEEADAAYAQFDQGMVGKGIFVFD